MPDINDLEHGTLDRGAAILPPGDDFELLPFDVIRTEDDIAILANHSNVQQSLEWVTAEGWRHTGPTEMTGTPGGMAPGELIAQLRTVRPQVASLKPVFARFDLVRPRQTGVGGRA